jgi:hypothetical protein
MDEREQAIKRLGLDSLKPTATLFTNVLGDTSLFESDRAFSSQAAWMIETIRQFASRPGNRLIIRIHPSEVRLRGREAREPMITQINGAYPELPNNISVIQPEDDISSYTLIDLSDLVLVYVSTIGLEAVLYGKSVVVAGRAHYIDKGFTLDVDDASRYGQLIDAGLARPALDPVKKELAWRYSNLYFRRFPISFPLMSYRSWPIRLNFESLAALAPGENEELDLICRFITESTFEDRINLTH